MRIADIRDGSSNTIMVLELPEEYAVVWTQPDDFDLEDEESLEMLFGAQHAGGLHALMCDGAVRFINENIDRDVLRALFTRDGREVIGF